MKIIWKTVFNALETKWVDKVLNEQYKRKLRQKCMELFGVPYLASGNTTNYIAAA